MVCNPLWRESTWAFFHYVPEVAPAVVFCILFLLAGFIHGFQMWKTKTWFLSALIIGCFLEFIGFAARIVSATQHEGCWTLTPYLLQSMFILLPPALYSASIYIILGRIILVTDGECHSVIKQRWLTKTFVLGDVFCFWLQGGGGGLLAGGIKSPTLAKFGNYIIIAGLAMQAVWFVFFCVVAGLFHMRMKKAPTATSQQSEVKWQRYLGTLYFVSALVMVRSIYRLIEYCQGNNGYLMSNEMFLYILDAAPMFVVVSLLSWKHPSEISFLLQGKVPYKNGFELMKGRKTDAGDLSTSSIEEAK